MFLKIPLLKPLRLSVSLIKLGKEWKILAPGEAKALCPVASLHLGNVSSLFCLVPLVNFWTLVKSFTEIVRSQVVHAFVNHNQVIKESSRTHARLCKFTSGSPPSSLEVPIVQVRELLRQSPVSNAPHCIMVHCVCNGLFVSRVSWAKEAIVCLCSCRCCSSLAFLSLSDNGEVCLEQKVESRWKM